MATLNGIPSEWSCSKLELTLAANPFGVDASEYTLRVIESSGEIFDRAFNVSNWQTEHDEPWLLARAYSEADILLSSTLDMDLWGNGGKRAASYSSRCGPIHLVMWGNAANSTIMFWLFVEIDVSLARPFFFRADVADIREFGNVMEAEIIAGAPTWAAENNRVPTRS